MILCHNRTGLRHTERVCTVDSLSTVCVTCHVSAECVQRGWKNAVLLVLPASLSQPSRRANRAALRALKTMSQGVLPGFQVCNGPSWPIEPLPLEPVEPLLFKPDLVSSISRWLDILRTL